MTKEFSIDFTSINTYIHYVEVPTYGDLLDYFKYSDLKSVKKIEIYLNSDCVFTKLIDESDHKSGKISLKNFPIGWKILDNVILMMYTTKKITDQIYIGYISLSDKARDEISKKIILKNNN